MPDGRFVITCGVNIAQVGRLWGNDNWKADVSSHRFRKRKREKVFQHFEFSIRSEQHHHFCPSSSRCFLSFLLKLGSNSNYIHCRRRRIPGTRIRPRGRNSQSEVSQSETCLIIRSQNTQCPWNIFSVAFIRTCGFHQLCSAVWISNVFEDFSKIIENTLEIISIQTAMLPYNSSNIIQLRKIHWWLYSNGLLLGQWYSSE